MLRLYRNHSALLDSLHAPTQPYTTTYPSCMLQWYCNHAHPVGVSDSEITLSIWQYLRIEYRPFHTISFWSLSMLPICRIFNYVNGLPTCRDCHYTSLGVCGRWRIRTSVPFLTAALAVRCFQPLSQPSLLSCLALLRKVFFRLLRRYGIATTALHRRSSISPDAKSL